MTLVTFVPKVAAGMRGMDTRDHPTPAPHDPSAAATETKSVKGIISVDRSTLPILTER